MAEVQSPILPSRLFRYRSLTRDEEAVDREINAIKGNYIYCSQFFQMNDPMEGFYQSSKILKRRTNYERIARDITDLKSGIGIACFTETKENILMWAHYAANYSGICVSYSTRELISGLSDNVKVVKVAYGDRPPSIYLRHVKDVGGAAVGILSQKKENWAYEREWRLLGDVGRVSLGPRHAVKAVYFGSRVKRDHYDRLLQEIQGMGIKAFRMNVSGYRHSWVRAT